MSVGGAGKKRQREDESGAPTGERRSKRVKTDKAKEYDWSASWEKYNAAVQDKGDGVPECVATIYWEYKNKKGTKKGATTSLCGHAEMDCLDELLGLCQDKGWDPKTFFEDGSFEVSCEHKSCCWRCSAVLGALGVKAKENTFKTKKSMLGGGSWGTSNKVKTFLSDFLKIEEANIEEMAKKSGNLS